MDDDDNDNDNDNNNNNNNKYKSPKHRIGPCPEAKIAVETYTQPVNLEVNFSKYDVPSYYIAEGRLFSITFQQQTYVCC